MGQLQKNIRDIIDKLNEDDNSDDLSKEEIIERLKSAMWSVKQADTEEDAFNILYSVVEEIVGENWNKR